MLGKLIKYDLKWINKYMMIYFSVGFIFAILCKITSHFTNVFVGLVLDKICSGIEIACLVSILVNCLMRCWVRFRNNLYKDESYLTHTLPVSKATIYNSKILASFISIIIAVIIIIICFSIVGLNEVLIKQIKNVFADKEVAVLFIIFCLIVLLEITYLVLCGIIGNILGHQSNNHKMAKTILITIILYGLLQCLLIGVIFIIGAFNNDVRQLYMDNVETLENLNGVKTAVYVTFGIYLIYNIGLYIFGKKMLEKGVNVD